jgi:hemerythrin-like metal-binding protein
MKNPNTPEAVIAWSDRLLLGFPAMDAEHRDFVARVSALQQACTDTDSATDTVAARLAEVEAHLQQHFGAEDTWMRDTAFPARDCHIDEHAAVLKSVHEVQALVAAGNTALVPSLADELARWFPGHADYLDSALAAWMCKQRWDARPVVIRRNLGAPC